MWRRSSPRLWGYYYDPVFGGNLTVLASDDSTLAADAVWIGAGVARNMRVNEGDLISLRGYGGLPTLFTVQKILPAESELVSSDLLLMSTQDVRTSSTSRRGSPRIWPSERVTRANCPPSPPRSWNSSRIPSHPEKRDPPDL